MDNLLLKLSDAEILALTIYGEARGEPIQGQVAVGCVIMNRFNKNRAKYAIIHDVCLERMQFSCWNSNDPNRTMLVEMAQELQHGRTEFNIHFSQCVFVAFGLVNRKLIDNTGGALNYMTSNLFNSDKKPSWATKVSNLKTVGSHVFFNV